MINYNSIISDIDDINGNYWIKANAGCGKTTKLVSRFIFLLKSGIKPEEIICITYTNAGAKEMKDRIINELTLLKESNPAQFNKSIDYDRLQIDTIHGICRKFLIQNKILSENVKIISSNIHEKNRIIREIIQSFSKAKYLENDIYSIAKSISYDEFRQIINNVIEKQNNFRELCEDVFDKDVSSGDIQNHRDLSFLLPSEIRDMKNVNIEKLANKIKNIISETDKTQLTSLFKKIKSYSKTKNIATQDINVYNLNEWKNIVFLTDKLVPRQMPKKLPTNIAELFCQVQYYFVNRQNKIVFDNTLAFLRIAKYILFKYERIKKQLNVITYDDILFETKKIAKMGQLQPIKYLMLDEAQDTNPISWEIISHFKQPNGNSSIIFVVGDEKQSIYSFQGANLDYYDKYYHFFKNRTMQENEQNWHDEVVLDTSYRSRKEILEIADKLCNSNIDAFCNNAFSSRVIKHKTAVEGNGIVVDKILSFNSNTEDQLSINNNKKSWYELLQQKIERQNKKQQIAQNIAKELFEISKQCKTTAIIVPKRNTKDEFAFDIIGELQEFTNVNFLPELAIKHIYFQDLLSIIKFAILQNDDLNLACLLKSELFNFTDNDLLDIRDKKKQLLFENLSSHSWQEKSKQAISFLRKILSIYTITDLLQEISLFIEKKQYCNVNPYKKAIQMLQEIHRSFLNNEGNDLNIRDFVDYIAGNNYKDNDTLQIKEGVFFSTIHGVKGLEFDNVILLDFEDRRASLNKEKYFFLKKTDNPVFLYKKSEIIFQSESQTKKEIDAIEEKQILEQKRLFYVAITRAKIGFYHFHCN